MLNQQRDILRSILHLGAWMLLVPVPAVSANMHAVSVTDSIAMERFVGPSEDEGTRIPRDYFSPDGRHLAVVTQRGLLSADELRDTVWLFDLDAVRGVVNGTSDAATVSPVPMARLEGKTKGTDNNDELAMVADLQWSADSAALLFRGRSGTAEWHVFQIDVRSRNLSQLTPDGQNVTHFTVGAGTIVYSVRPVLPAHELPASVVVTGRSLSSLLFPAAPNSWTHGDQLWRLEGGEPSAVLDKGTGTPIEVGIDTIDPKHSILEISPDGRYVAAVAVARSYPGDWSKYVSWSPQWAFPIQPPPAPSIGEPEQFVLVDLQKGSRRPILRAPLGRGVAYLGATAAKWSTDGHELLLTNTFLPLEEAPAAERASRLSGPYVIAYEPAADRWAVISRLRQSAAGELPSWTLTAAGWDRGDVVLAYGDKPNVGPPPARYRKARGAWQQVSDHSAATDAASDPVGRASVVLSIRQNLNDPPALYATASTHDVQIWDPNPQLRDLNLGEARTYNWQDSHGHNVKGVLFLPPHYAAGKRYPLVIEARAYSQDRFIMDGTYPTATAARAMAAADLVVLQAGEPSYPDHGKEWYRHSLEYALDGYKAGIARLASDGTVDAQRVGIIGFSRTCENVLYAATRAPESFAAVTIANGMVYGYLQFLAFVDFSVNGYGGTEYSARYGGPPYGPFLPTYLQENPAFNLDKVTAAVRVETHAPDALLFDWETYAGLRVLGRPVDMIMLTHASHEVSMPSDVLESQQGDLDWFRFWLQGYEDSDPAKAEQYRRWESLCDIQRARTPQQPTFCAGAGLRQR